MQYSEKFQKAVNFVLENEGGFTNDLHDTGGPTNFGITQEELSRFRRQPVSESQVKELKLEEAMEVYAHYYWAPLALDFISDEKLSIVIFDQAVNRGVVTVARQIQGLVGQKQDGQIGPITIKAINSASAKRLAIDFFKQMQTSYALIVKRSPEKATFLVGWLARTHQILELLLN